MNNKISPQWSLSAEAAAASSESTTASVCDSVSTQSLEELHQLILKRNGLPLTKGLVQGTPQEYGSRLGPRNLPKLDTATGGGYGEIEQEISYLNSVVEQMEQDVRSKQDLFRGEMEELSSKLKDAVCVPPIDKSLYQQ